MSSANYLQKFTSQMFLKKLANGPPAGPSPQPPTPSPQPPQSPYVLLPTASKPSLHLAIRFEKNVAKVQSQDVFQIDSSLQAVDAMRRYETPATRL